MLYKEIEGDLIELAKRGEFDVIAHGCNCQSVMGSGLAPKMAKAFGCDKYEMERWGPTIEKLGCIDYQTVVLGENNTFSRSDWMNVKDEPELIVVNAYTQYRPGVGLQLDYEALTLCLRKMKHLFSGQRIGLPQIGAGLAGGEWTRIKQIIQTELSGENVTVVIFKV